MWNNFSTTAIDLWNSLRMQWVQQSSFQGRLKMFLGLKPFYGWEIKKGGTQLLALSLLLHRTLCLQCKQDLSGLSLNSICMSSDTKSADKRTKCMQTKHIRVKISC